MDGLDQNRESPTRLRLAQALKRARGSLLWETVWPGLAGLLTVGALFLAFSWAGFWMVLPPIARAIGLVVFAGLLVYAAWPLLRLRVPTETDGLRRLDRGTGEAHRPASAIADRMATGAHDPFSQALWKAHVERALLSARKLKAGWPRPNVSLRDPVAIRALAVMLVVATFFAASGERGKRVMAAFDWDGVVPPANFRVDAWVTPPLYTGRPPVMLSGLHPSEVGSAAMPSGPISVPAGSVLVVRATGSVNIDVTHQGGLEAAAPEARAGLPAGANEHRLVIKSDGSAAVRGLVGRALSWQFTAIPDRAPTIALVKDPERQARGALRVDYKIDDDYGVTEARATVELKAAPSASARPLFDAPNYALVLPQARTRAGTAQTTHDLSDHPWAGAEVMMTLTAKDEAGSIGKSEPREVTLPQRVFVKPLARALIEQRRNLALDAETKPIVLTALDVLALAPEKFTPEAGIYLGLRSIYHQLQNARNDDALREVVARLWDMALQIEDGNVSDAERALRQAQEALRQALERGATDEELKKLMDNLRAAMDRFLQALAQEMQRNPQQLARPLDQNTRTLSQQDLKSMLDRLENLARSGNRDAAKQLLEQLQQMMENLQMARPGMQGDQGDDDMMSALDELSDMIRKQQQLRDRTFREGQNRQPGQQGQRGQQGQQGQQGQMGDLRQDQQALRDRLNKLLEQLRQRGLGQQPGEQGEGDQMGQLGDAGEAMGDAEGALGEGNADGAVDGQGRALEAMRKGAQGLAQQMQQGMGPGQGPGDGRPGRGRARADRGTDPLGRELPRRGRDYGDDITVKVPGEIEAQRARRILEELRRRFGEGFRPQLELDYIERLLQGF